MALMVIEISTVDFISVGITFGVTDTDFTILSGLQFWLKG